MKSMIISASRRTDIPAFYAEWFINRIREGYCQVPNPFNHRQVSTISLKPEDVDVIVFWTRNPRPLFPFLQELGARGFRSYFQFTLMNNPYPIESKSRLLAASLRTFHALSEIVGPDRIIWRYDPLVFSSITEPDFHRHQYGLIAGALQGDTRRSVISIVDIYKKAGKRLEEMARQGIEMRMPDMPVIGKLIASLRSIAHTNGMEIASCAEEVDLAPYGVGPGKCIDDQYIKQVFGIDAPRRKDPSQRQACGCVVSRDIGMYDSCLSGCSYCYATTDFARARANHARHDPFSPSLLGCSNRREKA